MIGDQEKNFSTLYVIRSRSLVVMTSHLHSESTVKVLSSILGVIIFVPSNIIDSDSKVRALVYQ